MLKSDATHWGGLAKFFHWSVVVLLLAQATLGLVMVELPKKPSVITWYTLHKSLGLTILLFALLRLGWRLFDRRPEEPASMPRWQVIGARAGCDSAKCAGRLSTAVLEPWQAASVARR